MTFVFNTKNKIVLGVVGFAVLSFIVIAIAINSNKTDSADLSSSVDSVVTSVEVSAETSFIPEQSSEVETSEVTSEDISSTVTSLSTKTENTTDYATSKTQESAKSSEDNETKESSQQILVIASREYSVWAVSYNDFGSIDFGKTRIDYLDKTVRLTATLNLKNENLRLSFDYENTYLITPDKAKSPLDSYELDENGLSTLHFSSVDLKEESKYTLTYVLKDEQTNTTMEPVTVWIDF